MSKKSNYFAFVSYTLLSFLMIFSSGCKIEESVKRIESEMNHFGARLDGFATDIFRLSGDVNDVKVSLEKMKEGNSPDSLNIQEKPNGEEITILLELDILKCSEKDKKKYHTLQDGEIEGTFSGIYGSFGFYIDPRLFLDDLKEGKSVRWIVPPTKDLNKSGARRTFECVSLLAHSYGEDLKGRYINFILYTNGIYADDKMRLIGKESGGIWLHSGSAYFDGESLTPCNTELVKKRGEIIRRFATYKSKLQ